VSLLTTSNFYLTQNVTFMKNLYLTLVALMCSFASFAVLPITGPGSVCTYDWITLSDATPGGTWSSANTLIATVDPSGNVSGVSAGTSTITYDVGGIDVTAIITVNPPAASIGGPWGVCIGGTSTRIDAGGGTWSTASGLFTIGSISGIVTGIAAGSARITYTLPTGCGTTSWQVVGVGGGTISGPTTICIGSTPTFTNSPYSLGMGGTWTSSNTSVITIDPSTGGSNGVAAGPATISFSIGGSCISTYPVTVSGTGPGPISGSSTVCIGLVTPLTDATPGGTWTASSSLIATVGSATGAVTGIFDGTETITYSVSPGCLSTMLITVVGTYYPITGTVTVCPGTTTALSDRTGGGIWTSSNTAAATVGSSSGVVAGVAPGTSVISYSFGIGCGVATTVSVTAGAAVILGTPTLCTSAITTLTDAVPGGTWTSSNTLIATVGIGSGIVAGMSSGTATITYSTLSGCYPTQTVTVYAVPSAILGSTTICPGSTSTLSDAFGGGLWSSSNTSVASIGSITGVVTGSSLGTSTISYTTGGGCGTAATVTVNPSPGSVLGTLDACIGSTTTLTDATAGGTWSSGNTGVATIAIGSGVATGVAAGTAIISYIIPTGCFATATLTVNPSPAITATSSYGCGDLYTLTGAGGVSYSWAPSTGLSCSTCGTTTTNPSATTTYTVTGTDGLGCANTGTVTVNGDRINGFITFTGPTPDTLDMKVWLIQFNPTDSSITALDSMNTCYVDSVTYYEFDGKPAGTYMVKARMTYEAAPGASGYIPTYGSSTPNWYSAATVAHSGASDSIHINMIYGSVPAGPGFIGGYVYLGAGKGTSGDIPVVGMEVYLMDKTGKALTRTFTAADGSYSFSGLAYGSYAIYPEEYDYNTVSPGVMMLNATTPSLKGQDFRQYNSARLILPYNDATYVPVQTVNEDINLYPNPTTGVLNVEWKNQVQGNAAVVITDVLGREVYTSALNITSASGQTQINVEGLKPGVYEISVKSANLCYSGKLVIR
jgi:uncharacterized protein YjdB